MLPKIVSKLSLRTVLIVPFLIQVTVAVGLTGYFSWRNGQKTINDMGQQLSHETSDHVHQHVSHFMELPQTVTQINVNAAQLGELDWSQTDIIERYLWHQMQLFQDLNPIAFANEQGEIWSVTRSENRSLLIRVLNQSTQRQYRTYTTTERGDRAKLVRVNTTFAPRLRPWYQTAATTGKPVWSEIYPYFSSPGLAISAARPFYDAQTNALLGVTNATVSLRQLSHFLRETRGSGHLFILERSGNLVASSTAQMPDWVNPDDQTLERLPAIASPDPVTRLTAQNLLEKFGSFEAIEHDYSVKVTLDSDRYFLQVTPFADPYGLDWLIVILLPEAEFTAQLEANTRTTTVLCLVALVGAIALGVLTSQCITQYVLRLSNASQLIADGQLDQRIDETIPIRELETMARSFNQMAERLQRSFEHVKGDLEKSEEKFTKVFRSSPDPIIVATLNDGRYLDINESGLRLLGFSREEVIGHSSIELNI